MVSSADHTVVHLISCTAGPNVTKLSTWVLEDTGNRLVCSASRMKIKTANLDKTFTLKLSNDSCVQPSWQAKDAKLFG